MDLKGPDHPDKVKIVESLLENLPPTEEIPVTLPSEGRLYEDHDGMATVRPINFEDEKFLVASQKEGADPANVLLARCCQGVDISQLLIFDKVFLLFKLREISYGSDFPCTVTCSKCFKTTDMVVDMTELVIQGLPKGWKEPRPLKLPTLKKTFYIRLPRVKDEPYIDAPEKVLDNLWRFVSKIENVKDAGIIQEVITKLPSKDLHTLILAINPEDIGVNPKIEFYCNSCDKTSLVEVPIGPDFFTGS
jgi:hypothetical protein